MSNSLCSILPGKFVKPTGAQLRSISNEGMESALVKVWKEIGRCFAYPKADGWRIQIHKQGNEVRLYSRKGIDYAETYPSIVQMIRTHVLDDQVIMDIELVGFDQYGCHLEPSKLKKASEYRCYLLDALYLDRKDLTLLPARERIPFIQECLQDTFDVNFTFAEYTTIESQNDLIRFYKECRERREEGFDGAIIKQLNTSYFEDVLKLKSEEPIDAVVIAAYRNKQGEVISFLLAVQYLEDGCWIPITKVSRKQTDWETVWLACQPYIQNHRPSHFDNPPDKPDIWFAPEVVAEVTVTGLRRGKDYLVYADYARNCVLREDKGPDEATSFEQVLQMANLMDQTEVLRKNQTMCNRVFLETLRFLKMKALKNSYYQRKFQK